MSFQRDTNPGKDFERDLTQGVSQLSESTPSIIRRDSVLSSSHVEILQSEGASIACYKNSIPSFIEKEIEQLYHNVFSSLAHFRAYGGLPADTCTYVARNGQDIAAIFLFRQVQGTVVVLNEGMKVDDKAINDFSQYVFSTWSTVTMIVFQAIRTQFKKIGFPYQRHECTAQVTMPLPASEEIYLAGLGKNMRRNIRRYLKRLTQDFPSFQFDLYAPGEIQEHHLRTIFELSRSRITSMSKGFALSSEEEKIYDLAKTSGLIGVATIDGKVCAGMIGFRTGSTYFAKVLGHDSAYKDYSLGILCCYLMICGCMRKGCTEFNFMWNEYPYKAALGGTRLGLERLVVYRSSAQLLLHGDFAAKVAMEGWRFRLSSLLEKEGMEESLRPAERVALRALLKLRKWRQLLRAHSVRSNSAKEATEMDT